jgi:UDP-3-O-[3-hydroxymyristoyl] glucosamine N-acyltransferase
VSWDDPVGDPRFFQRTGPHSLAAVADAARCEAPPRRLLFRGVAPLSVAGPDEVSFLDNRKYLPDLGKTAAGAVIVSPELSDQVPDTAVAIVTDEVYAAWARVATLFHPPPPAVPGIHPTAIIGADARIDPTAEIGPLAVIGAGAVIGRRTRIGPLAVIGPNVEIGADCRIASHATVTHARLGDRVFLYPGVRVGQAGFGFATTEEGFLTVPQLGRVLIDDDVEIGANTTVDRGGMTDTMIGAGTRIDNLVQIAHGVRIGRCCVLVALAGIAGSAVIEDYVLVGGQVGIAGHLHVGGGAKLAAQAGVMQDVPPGAEMGGSPAQPRRAWMREVAWLRRVTRAQGWGKTTDKKAD